jgi:methyl-accepting chemotaxis protein
VHTNRTGSELVQRNGQIMERIAGSIREVSSVLEGISRDLDMQKQEIEQIHCSIDEVEQTTSENEGQVERTAAICGDILEAAQGMRRLLDDMTHLGRRSQSDR